MMKRHTVKELQSMIADHSASRKKFISSITIALEQ